MTKDNDMPEIHGTSSQDMHSMMFLTSTMFFTWAQMGNAHVEVDRWMDGSILFFQFNAIQR